MTENVGRGQGPGLVHGRDERPMAVINKKYPGKSDEEIYAKVDSVMEGIARCNPYSED